MAANEKKQRRLQVVGRVVHRSSAVTCMSCDCHMTSTERAFVQAEAGERI